MLRIGIIDLSIRALVFFSSVIAYLGGADIASMWRVVPFQDGFSAVQLIWLLMIAGMMLQLSRDKRVRPPGEKAPKGRSKGYGYVSGLDDEVKKMNAGARKALFFWLFLSGLVMLLYFNGILGESEVLIVVLTYYFCDSLCMIFWCPLQKFFMKSLCCKNCRIYGWGYFFDFGLLLLLPGVLSYSLVFLALLLLVRWEFAYATHPEKFWAGTNTSLRCSNCVDKSCFLKNKNFTKRKFVK